MGKNLHSPPSVVRIGHSFENVAAVLVEDPHLHGEAQEVPVSAVEPALVPHLESNEIPGVKAIPVEGPELFMGIFRAILKDRTPVFISSIIEGDRLQPVVAELLMPNQIVHVRPAV